MSEQLRFTQDDIDLLETAEMSARNASAYKEAEALADLAERIASLRAALPAAGTTTSVTRKGLEKLVRDLEIECDKYGRGEESHTLRAGGALWAALDDLLDVASRRSAPAGTAMTMEGLTALELRRMADEIESRDESGAVPWEQEFGLPVREMRERQWLGAFDAKDVESVRAELLKFFDATWPPTRQLVENIRTFMPARPASGTTQDAVQDQPIVWVGSVLRFQANAIVRYLLDKGNLTLNDLGREEFPTRDWEQFYQLIGYSLSGYDELSLVSEAAKDRAEARRKALITVRAHPEQGAATTEDAKHE